ncbi:MAG TPA: acyl-CoA dehydrogenase family protein [Polyangia bacterium]|jgi:alkylation response protein AidB-like acyl-CoA dehydrogenase|nr:acyl-CoA dehydrogenase family protein [Polyangia bacterium]
MMTDDIVVALHANVRKWARERLPIAHLRALRDSHDAVGFSRDAWLQWAELGLAGVTLGEDVGGSALGYGALGLAVTELGRSLAPLPWLSALLGGGAIALGGSDAQQRTELPALVAGTRLPTLAHDEGTRHRRHRVAARATRTPTGFALDGGKTMVLDGHVADVFVVSARTSGADEARDGITLFLVDARAPGVTVTRSHVVDSRNVARVQLARVTVGEADVVGAIDRGADVLDPLFDRATIVLAAEMLGSLEEAFARTLAHLKSRRQFGVLLGSFQALQHRAARAWCELELTRALVAEALAAADGDDAALTARLACAAKARASDAFIAIASEAVQLHGGIGVTDELDIGLFYKRAHVAAQLLGDAAYQRDRFATLSGY